MIPRAPDETATAGLQHERTALAWERTAVAMLVVSLLLARYGADDAPVAFAILGMVGTLFGAALLVWAGRHYEDLHGPLQRGSSVVNPGAARMTGTIAVGVTAAALVYGLWVAIT